MAVSRRKGTPSAGHRIVIGDTSFISSEGGHLRKSSRHNWLRVQSYWKSATAAAVGNPGYVFCALCALFILYRYYLQVVYEEAVLDLALPLATNSTICYCRLGKSSAGHMLRSAVHFPFIVEWVAGCYSWLIHQSETMEDQQYASLEHMGAIVLDGTIYRRTLVQPNFPLWNRAFFQALQLPVIKHDDDEPSVYHSFFLEEHDDPFFHPSARFYERRFGISDWFGDNTTCNILRKQLWTSLGLLRRVHSARRSKKWKIGVLERPARRHIVNSRALAQELQARFSNQTVVSYHIISESHTFAQQAAWYSEQDIVIMAHGAACTNVIFMRAGTHVIELFPRNFFHEMYKPLVQQCGVSHHWYYDGGSNPWKDFSDHMSERGRNRNKDISVTVDDLESIILPILGEDRVP